MRDGAHMRLTLTRGVKCTSSMNPKFNVHGTTLIVLAEWKGTEDRTTYDNTKGVKLITAAGRRNGPDMLGEDHREGHYIIGKDIIMPHEIIHQTNALTKSPLRILSLP